MRRDSGWRSENKGLPCEFAEEVSLHRLIIEIEKQPEKTVNGIIIAEETRNKEDQANMTATVLAIGREAWADKSSDACDVGDRVIVGRYVGTRLQNTNGRDVRLVSDLEILGRALAKID